MRNSEKLRAFRESLIVSSPRLTYSAIADNPEGGLAGKGVRAARAGRNFWGETRRDFETLGETGSEGGDGGLKVGKERVVFFWGD